MFGRLVAASNAFIEATSVGTGLKKNARDIAIMYAFT